LSLSVFAQVVDFYGLLDSKNALVFFGCAVFGSISISTWVVFRTTRAFGYHDLRNLLWSIWFGGFLAMFVDTSWYYAVTIGLTTNFIMTWIVDNQPKITTFVIKKFLIAPVVDISKTLTDEGNANDSTSK